MTATPTVADFIATAQRVRKFLSDYPNAWIFEPSSKQWYNVTTGATSTAKAPATGCEWRWDASLNKWVATNTPHPACPPGQNCEPRDNSSPMPDGMIVLVPCHT